MYLKCIEIHGFKSFANKIKFEFPHGVTAIVGPNGSGKSNIGDAVRWVLGEQSAKQLRGSKMEDVIFSGTQSRKPMGFAYVTISFDNSDRKIALDYDEVKVGRRVYRSGESEYLLNGVACRRRDIVELFYDTGIGKEGYSIIGQGQVEKILSGKIEDSRDLFDEAVGIAKIKKNRAITERSLAQERQNLERVTDVLNELEKRVGPLEKQSRKAKEYLRLKEREKEEDVHLFLYDHGRLESEIRDLERQQAILSGDLSETRKNQQAIREENDALEEEYRALSEETERLEQARKGLAEERERLEAERLGLLHKTDSNETLIRHYEEAAREAAGKCGEAKTALLAQARRREEQEALLETFTQKCSDAEAALRLIAVDRAKLAASIAAERDAISALLDESTGTREQLSRYETLEEQLAIRRSEYNGRFLACESELKQIRASLSELEEKERTTSGEEKKAGEAYEKLCQASGLAQEEEDRLLGELEAHHQEFLRLRSRYETLESMSERYDGYQHSIKQVMEQKKTHPGILGVVADLISTAPAYETAIEIALGGALQNIVTEDDRVAKEMIAFLKKNRSGRATFLPLNHMRKRNAAVNPDILEEEGVLGTADSLVETEARYRDLAASLLGRTIVTDTVDHAVFLARKYRFSLRLVTLGGELISPGGSMTGGAYKRSGNLLGRRREIEECKEKLRTEKAACEKIRSRQKELSGQKAARKAEMEESRKAAEALTLALHDLHRQIPALRAQEEEQVARLASLKGEYLALKEQLAEIQTQKQGLLEDQESHVQVHEQNSEKLLRLEAALAAKDAEEKEAQEARNQAQVDVAAAGQQIAFLKEEETRLKSEREEWEENARTHRKNAAALAEENSAAAAKKTAIADRLALLSEQLAGAGDALQKQKEAVRESAGRRNAIFHSLEAENEKLLLLEKEDSRVANRKEKAEQEFQGQIDYMWENYELTWHQALELRRYEIRSADAAAHRKEKKELRRQIRELGPVNVDAIEEYREVGERYAFLKEQYDDVAGAEEKLTAMIEELNASMREQFAKNFEEIRRAFTGVFQDLFEGGTADLALMDPENMLECGIRIVAQPPGKKLQNILLLSGGERALTAIALLFAIQRLKPSPFCLLDEIEAALDDANILRFSRYLRKLSEETQFIVITHRRGTMTAADSLYGITMQEKGISTLISVDLIDKDLQ